MARICPSCGKKLTADSIYCPKCGKKPAAYQRTKLFAWVGFWLGLAGIITLAGLSIRNSDGHFGTIIFVLSFLIIPEIFTYIFLSHKYYDYAAFTAWINLIPGAGIFAALICYLRYRPKAQKEQMERQFAVIRAKEKEKKYTREELKDMMKTRNKENLERERGEYAKNTANRVASLLDEIFNLEYMMGDGQWGYDAGMDKKGRECEQDIKDLGKEIFKMGGKEAISQVISNLPSKHHFSITRYWKEYL